jgi:hypothetical protein
MSSAVSYSIPAGITGVTIKGQGQDLTTLNWPNASGGLTINYNSLTSSAHIRDLSLTTSQVNSGTALTLALASSVANPADTAVSDIYRVAVHGADGWAASDYWSSGININNVSNVQLDNVAIFGASTSLGFGLSLVGLPGSSTYGVQYNISKSTFQYLNVGLSYGSYVQGVTVDQTNFTGDNYGIFANSGLTGTLDQLTVANSQFNCFLYGIVTSTQIGNTSFTGNIVIVNGANSVGFQINQYNANISGNNISATTTSGTKGIVINSGSGGSIISDNWITGSSVGLLLNSGTNILVHNNQFGGNTTPITNNGTARIIDNPGYNPVGAAAITTSASPFTYTAGASPETDYWGATTISAITQGGVSILAGTVTTQDVTTQLGPSESIVITYTGTLVGKKMVH